MIEEAARAALERGRRAAEALMWDTVQVTDPGQPSTDASGDVTTGGAAVYEGPGKRQTTAATDVRNPEAGEHQFTAQRDEAHFPVGAFVPKANQVITWVACPTDPDRAGTQDRIIGVFTKTAATAMRLPIERLEGGQPS